MYKATIEIGRINKSLKLKFGLIINSETEKQSYNKLVNKFSYMGNTYLKITPRPFVTLDISSKNDDGWNSNQMVNLNKLGLFSFTRLISQLIKEFREIKDLFYYENNKLILNNEQAKKITKNMISSNKYIRVQPCVVPDDEIEGKRYEGCIFCINTYDNFCYMTFSEMEYLYYELSHINMLELSMNLLNTVKSLQNEESKDLKIETTNSNINDARNKIEEIPYIKITDGDELPF